MDFLRDSRKSMSKQIFSNSIARLRQRFVLLFSYASVMLLTATANKIDNVFPQQSIYHPFCSFLKFGSY